MRKKLKWNVAVRGGTADGHRLAGDEAQTMQRVVGPAPSTPVNLGSTAAGTHLGVGCFM